MIDAERLEILTESAKYDVSCSSSGSKRVNTAGGLGNASVGGICHSFTPDGRCISLLKIANIARTAVAQTCDGRLLRQEKFANL